MSTLSTTVRRGLVVTAAAMAAGPVVGGVASAATEPTANAPLDIAPISTAAAPVPMTRSALPVGGLPDLMPLTGGLTKGLPVNNLTNNIPLNKLTGLPVSGLAGQVPVVGPMAQNLPVVKQLDGKPEVTPAEDAAAGQQAAAALKSTFQPPHMPTPPAFMRPAHATRSRTVAPATPATPATPAMPAAPAAPIAPSVSAPTITSATTPAAPAAAKSSSPLTNLPLIGGLTSGLPVSGLIPGF